MLSFRDMTLQDLSCVTQLESEASAHPWKSSDFQDCLSKPRHTCHIASINDENIGHSVLMTVADEAHLLILTVGKSNQRKGYGSQLLQHLIEQASHKANTLFLEVRSSNDKAFQLYLNEGFSEIGRRRNYYPATATKPADDAIVMALDLSFL